MAKCALVALAALGHAAQAQKAIVEDCLADAIPAISRTKLIGNNLTDSPEDLRPLGIWYMDWPSGRIVAEIFNIIAHEMLGYQMRTEGHSVSSLQAYYAVAGCRNPHIPSGCGPPISDWHVVLETWEREEEVEYKYEFQQQFSRVAPEDLGSIGYSGVETLYILGEQGNLAWEAEGLSLDWFRSYNLTWYTPQVYFDSPTVFDSTAEKLDLLRPCSELADAEHMEYFLKYTGDEDGVERDADGNLRAKCWDQTWWLSPACRDKISECIVTFTGGHAWDASIFMQKAVYYGMPVAISVARNESVQVSLARRYASIFYWFEPDTKFIDLAPHRIMFEPHDSEAWMAHDERTGPSMLELHKFGWYDLKNGAADVHALASNMYVYQNEMKSMLLEAESLGQSPRTVACSWLNKNPHEWLDWLELPTVCIPGQGLVQRVQFVGARENATGCEWCPPGRFSEVLTDATGLTYVCLDCQPGYYQSLPGEMECMECVPGSYTNTIRRTECADCQVGAYQPERTATDCALCDSPKTTLMFGSRAETECVCPEGMYEQLGGACASCGTGLHCSTGSREALIPSRPSSLAPCDEVDCPYPYPLPMYFATYKEPFSVFLCVSEVSCPGYAIERCGANMEGVACASCLDGYHRGSDGECSECGSDPLSWLKVMWPLVLVPCILIYYRVNGGDVDMWNSPEQKLGLVAYLCFSYCQTLGLVIDTQSEFPSMFLMSMDWTKRIVDITKIFRVDCVFDPAEIFLRKLVLPGIIASFFPAIYLIAAVLSHHRPGLRLDPDRLFNCFGAFVFTFYISIASSAFSLFRVYEHPNGEFSLLNAPSILWKSDTWASLLGAAIFAVVFFCIFSLAVLSWALYVAPQRYAEEVFRTRWRFVLCKFRPSVWWWGVAVLFKGLWINLTTVCFYHGTTQLTWATVGMLTYAGFTFCLMPWRFFEVSWLEAIHCGFLVGFLAFSTHFVEDDDMVLPLFRTVEVILVIPLVASAFVFCKLMLARYKEIKNNGETEQLCPVELQETFEVLALMGSPKSWPMFVRALQVMSDAELRTLLQARDVMRLLVFTGASGRRSCQLGLKSSADFTGFVADTVNGARKPGEQQEMDETYFFKTAGDVCSSPSNRSDGQAAATEVPRHSAVMLFGEKGAQACGYEPREAPKPRGIAEDLSSAPAGAPERQPDTQPTDTARKDAPSSAAGAAEEAHGEQVGATDAGGPEDGQSAGSRRRGTCLPKAPAAADAEEVAVCVADAAGGQDGGDEVLPPGEEALRRRPEAQESARQPSDVDEEQLTPREAAVRKSLFAQSPTPREEALLAALRLRHEAQEESMRQPADEAEELTPREAAVRRVLLGQAGPRPPRNVKRLRHDILHVDGKKRYGLAILGGESPPLSQTTSFLKRLGAQVRADISHSVVIVTASMQGIEHAFIRCCGSDVEHRHLVLKDDVVQFTEGKGAKAGECNQQLRGALLHVADIFIVVEADEESAEDAEAALQRGAKVIPVTKYGGAIGLSPQALRKPEWASAEDWEHMSDGLDPSATADSVLQLIQQIRRYHPRRSTFALSKTPFDIEVNHPRRGTV